MAKKRVKYSNLWWRGKADKLITKLYTGQPCVICKTMGRINTYQTCGHHVVNKSLSAFYRHDLRNIIPLCQEHHTMGVEIAAHSRYALAVAEYLKWLKIHRPVAYKILKTYKRKGACKVNYEQACERLEKYIREPDFGEGLMYPEIE